MANIIGEPFDDFVQKQIKARQEALGKTSIDPNVLKWTTTKAPWLRLASSVDVDEKIIAKLGIDANLEGSGLAKNFILFGGASNESGNLQSGINFSNNALNGEYGWGGIGERGFVPMPGITSAEVSYYNNGALAKAKVKIKAYSREQFALIDYLYMRPGYSLLLEFGHTVYLDNDGNLQQWDKFQSAPLEDFLKGDIRIVPAGARATTTTARAAGAITARATSINNQYAIQTLINNEKERYNGNYEGFIGPVSKFSWSFNKDGSYDIDLELIAYGSIIESLKMNVVSTTSTQNVDENGEEVAVIIADKNNSKINEWLYEIYSSFSKETQNTSIVFTIPGI